MAEDIQETVILGKNLPPRLPGNKLALQYRVESPNADVSNWSPVYYVNGPIVQSDSLTSENLIGMISASVLTNNVATITTNVIHELSAGDYVNIWDRGQYSGIRQVSAITNTTAFQVNIVYSNIASNTTNFGAVFRVNHTDTSITANASYKSNTASYQLYWTDNNPTEFYDIFVYKGIEIGDIIGTVNARSVDTTKTIYFPTGYGSLISQFSVGDYIDVAGVAIPLNGAANANAASEMIITQVSSDENSPPLFIRYTGDSTDTLVNTAVTSGFIGFTDNADIRPPITRVPYEYLFTYQSTGSESFKSYTSEILTNSLSGVQYTNSRFLIQVAGSNRSIDTALRVAETRRI